jgi:HAD superfamily hydrolase (TIGR01509 family)
MDDLLAYYAAHHSAMASLHSGIVEILDFLRHQGTKLAIFTGKGRRTTAITLRALELHGYFDLVVSGNDVTRHKPDPEGILKVLREFSVLPGQALMVGDSINDVRAARAAGVRIASVLWDCYDPDRIRQAQSDYLFERVDDLREWFMSESDLGQALVN